MNTRSGLVASVAGASLLLGITDVCAAPSTVYMEGTTAFYFDFSTGATAPYAGQPFSVTVTLDLANGSLLTSSLPDNSFSYRYSESGCPLIVNGVCEGYLGAQLPVVTDYSVNVSFAPGGVFLPVPASAQFWDETSRLNQRHAGMNPAMDTYAIERSQRQCVVTGDPEAYEQRCTDHILSIELITHDNKMFADLMDLNATPNLASVPPGYLGFTYTTSTQVDSCVMKEAEQAIVCELTYLPGSAIWAGTLTSVVTVGEGPTTKEACKKNGWKAFGFKNQGQCVSYVNHLP